MDKLDPPRKLSTSSPLDETSGHSDGDLFLGGSEVSLIIWNLALPPILTRLPMFDVGLSKS